MYITTTADEYKAMTNRQLLREYRERKDLEADLVDAKERGWKTYLGETILKVGLENRTNLRRCTAELKARGIKMEKVVLKSRPPKTEWVQQGKPV